MQKVIKAGILIVLLVVPASVFLFLKGFGENHYTVKTFHPLIDSSSGLPIIQKKKVYNREENDTIFYQIPPFSFTDSSDWQVTSSVTDQKIFIAHFFSTPCGATCLRVFSEMSRVQDVFLKKQSVVLVSFAADSANTDQPALSEYAKQFQVRAGKWYLLKGDQEKVEQLAQYGFKMSDLQTEGDPKWLLESGAKLVLVDENRHIRGYYDGTDPKEVDRLILETKILLSESEKK
jgi:protein SCO1/2